MGFNPFLNIAVELRRLVWKITRPVGASVRVLLVQEGKVLLVRHTYGKGWLLPGGAARSGETLDQAARRECEEELGYRPTSLRLEGIFTNFVEGKSDHIAVFSTRASDIPGKKNAEIAEFAFFDRSALPQDILGGHRRRIVEFFRNPSWPKSGEW